jgi:hypothetical protein
MIQPLEQPLGAVLIGLGLGRVLADGIEVISPCSIPSNIWVTLRPYVGSSSTP